MQEGKVAIKGTEEIYMLKTRLNSGRIETHRKLELGDDYKYT